MVTELLVLSQAGEVDAPPERVDLEDARAPRRGALGRRRRRPRALGRRSRRRLRARAPTSTARIDALVENAIHYGNGEVEVRARAGAVDVLDRGPGLTDEDLEAVFERFHRGAAGRAGPNGTGLGLPIARELARRWGGDVTLANRDGGGARATLTVPPFPGP